MKLKEKIIIAIISALSIVIVGLTLYAYWINDFLNFTYFLGTDKLGHFGDFIGGFLGTILTGIATFLVYKTYISQKKELDGQRKLISQQQFESTFFNLINLHRELKNNLTTDHRIFWFTEYQIDYLSANDNNELFNEIFINRKKSGLAVFRLLHIDLNNLYKSTEINKYLEFYNKNPNLKTNPYIIEIISQLKIHIEKIDKIDAHIMSEGIISTNKNFEEEKIKICFELLFKQHSDVISHYCRNVYHILKYLRENEENEPDSNKKLSFRKYADIFQSQLSVDEQFILFYNFIIFDRNDNEKYFHPIEIINHYQFLENLGSNNLLHKELHNNKKFYTFDIK